MTFAKVDVFPSFYVALHANNFYNRLRYNLLISNLCFHLIFTVMKLLIRVRPPKDFGPKAQNLEGVRTRLRKCGTDITR